MKIIKGSKKIGEPIMNVICKRCEAVLEIDASDLRPYSFLTYDGTLCYDCPCCDYDGNCINKKELPQEIINGLSDDCD